MDRDPFAGIPGLEDASLLEFRSEEVVQSRIQAVQREPHLDNQGDHTHVCDRDQATILPKRSAVALPLCVETVWKVHPLMNDVFRIEQR